MKNWETVCARTNTSMAASDTGVLRRSPKMPLYITMSPKEAIKNTVIPYSAADCSFVGRGMFRNIPVMPETIHKASNN